MNKTTKGERGEREEEKRKGVPMQRGRQHGLWREPTPPRFPREPLALLVSALHPTPAAPKEKGQKRMSPEGNERGRGERGRGEGLRGGRGQ